MDQLPCPRCAAALATTGDRHSCPACGGLFIGRSLVASVLSALRSEAPPIQMTGSPYRSTPRAAATVSGIEKDPRYLRCPFCGTQMSRSRVGGAKGVVLDACLLHGVWFDRDELQSASGPIAARMGEILSMFLPRDDSR